MIFGNLTFRNVNFIKCKVYNFKQNFQIFKNYSIMTQKFKWFIYNPINNRFLSCLMTTTGKFTLLNNLSEGWFSANLQIKALCFKLNFFIMTKKTIKNFKIK